VPNFLCARLLFLFLFSANFPVVTSSLRLISGPHLVIISLLPAAIWESGLLQRFDFVLVTRCQPLQDLLTCDAKACGLYMCILFVYIFDFVPVPVSTPPTVIDLSN
jgi:hypothetical protein